MPYDGDAQDFKTTFDRDGTASRAVYRDRVDPQVRKDLEAARALLAKGWCQGEAMSWDNTTQEVQSRCLLNAVSSVTVSHLRYMQCVEALKEQIGLSAQTGRNCLVYWNDGPDRTQAEVLQMFDAILGET